MSNAYASHAGDVLIEEAQRGPLWLWVLISLAMVGLFAYLRLVAYPEDFVPLTAVLALLVCLWHRDARLLWGMVAAFVAITGYKLLVLVPEAHAVTSQDWLFAAMQVANLLVSGVIIYAVIRLAVRLEQSAAQLRKTNGHLEASNEELTAREEELSHQNEELQCQSEELEQQTEELNTQAEELQALNEQLAEREGILRDLLDITADGRGEAEMLDKLGETIQRLLGDRAAGAAVLIRADAVMEFQPLFGVSPAAGWIARDQSLAELILSRDRAGSLADVAMRPDLEMPPLADGRQIRSLAAAPLRQGHTTDGALEIYSAEPRNWSEYELRVVQWLAEQCGSLLATATLRAERESLLESERAARTEAERANYAKDEFVAMLSHELRTPLHAVLGWAAVLRKTGGSNPEELSKGLEVIERNARHQGQLISDLLDISRVIAGKLHLDLQRVDLPLVIDNALDSIRQAAEAKGVRLEHSVGNLDGDLIGDPDRVQQVVWNLLSNAIKFTAAEGEVGLTVTQRATHVEIVVRDNGEGIDPAILPHLFERFRQADGSATRRHGGLGLGLAIVKNIVELHGGWVTARSDGLGAGATFTVALPVRTAGESVFRGGLVVGPSNLRGLDSDVPALTGLTILIVDDEQDARDLIRRILTERGAIVHDAASGQAALDRLDEIRPDLLISDISMPGMDGYALIGRIRERAAGRRLPAIALTAFARSEDRTRALLAGFQSHVAKPVESVELVAAVASLRYAPWERSPERDWQN